MAVQSQQKGDLKHWTGIDFQPLTDERIKELVNARGYRNTFGRQIYEQLVKYPDGISIGPIVGDDKLTLDERLKYIQNAAGNVIHRTGWAKKSPVSPSGRHMRAYVISVTRNGTSATVEIARVKYES